MKTEQITKAYEMAKERYAALGVDTDKARNSRKHSYIPALLAG